MVRKSSQHTGGEIETGSNSIELYVIARDIKEIKDDVSEIKMSLKTDYVDCKEFEDLKERVNTLDTRFWAAIVLAITSLLSTVTTLLVMLLRK